jgi:serine/threonine protein kinase
MHELGFSHRDLKVENILVNSEVNTDNQSKTLVFKLADFGSATGDHSIDFTKASKKEIGKFLDKIEKSCTRMYRAPEMIDQY